MSKRERMKKTRAERRLNLFSQHLIWLIFRNERDDFKLSDSVLFLFFSISSCGNRNRSLPYTPYHGTREINTNELKKIKSFRFGIKILRTSNARYTHTLAHSQNKHLEKFPIISYNFISNE